MNDNTVIKLHLGCGDRYLDGYTNIDFPTSEHTVMKVKADVYQDVRTLEYKDGSVDEIRTHHMFEHFSRQEALKLLAQWRRWLKPNGVLRIEMPDFGRAAFWYSFSGLRRRFELSRHIFGSQEAKWAFHLDGWDRKKLKFVLKQFGFKKVKINRYANSVGKRFKWIPFAGFMGRFLPRSMYKTYGGNKLPDIEAIAIKGDSEIDEKSVITAILRLSLVGPEGDNVLNPWLKDIGY